MRLRIFRLRSKKRKLFGFRLPAMTNTSPTHDEDISFKQYLILVDLYKHWLELILRYNAAYYLITGAMVSYALGQRDPLVRASLVLPIVIGIGLILYARGCMSIMTAVEIEMVRLKGKLGVGITPEVHYVRSLLNWSSLFFGITVVGLILALFSPLIRSLWKFPNT
jgi:hypothetical protein